MMDFLVFDSLLDGVLVIDHMKKIVYANEAAGVLLGLPIKKITKGVHCYDLVQFDDPTLLCMPSGSWGVSEPTPYKEIAFKTDGVTGKVQLSIQPLVQAGQSERDQTLQQIEEPRWIIYLRNVTLEESLHRKYKIELEKKELIIQELKETQDQLVQSSKMAMLGQVIPAISHELNNPLALVLSSVEELVRVVNFEDPDMTEIKELSNFVYKGAQRIMHLSKQLKSFLHSPLGLENFEYCDISVPVENAISFTHHFTTNTKIKVINHVPKNLPRTLVDPTLIEQIVINLIRNSVDAIEENHLGRPGVIEVTARFQENSKLIMLSFADNGPGMPKEVMKKLFTPFFTTKKVGKGTGLGLSICSAIAERHGGSLSVQSEVGTGTTFSLNLPVMDLTERAQKLENQQRMDDLKILLVDDEPLIRGIQKRLLIPLGCKITEAGTGTEGLTAFERDKPDFVITDLLMPEMSGAEMAAAIREKDPDACIILITGSASAMTLQEERSLFDSIIVKPFQNDRIRKAILEILRGEKRQPYHSQ